MSTENVKAESLTPSSNENPERLRRKNRTLHANAATIKVELDRLIFRRASEAYRKVIKTSKQNGWRSFRSKFEKGVEAARLDKIVSKNPVYSWLYEDIKVCPTL